MPPIKKAKRQQKKKGSPANRLNYLLTAAIAASMVLSSLFVFGAPTRTNAPPLPSPTIRVTDTPVAPVLTNATPSFTVTPAATSVPVTPTP